MMRRRIVKGRPSYGDHEYMYVYTDAEARVVSAALYHYKDSEEASEDERSLAYRLFMADGTPTSSRYEFSVKPETWPVDRWYRDGDAFPGQEPPEPELLESAQRDGDGDIIDACKRLAEEFAKLFKS